MKLLSTLFLFLSFSLAVAQYTTPGTGVNWTLDDIAAASPGTITVSGSTYNLLEDLTIAATDFISINSDLTLEIEAGLALNKKSLFVMTGIPRDNATVAPVATPETLLVKIQLLSVKEPVNTCNPPPN